MVYRTTPLGKEASGVKFIQIMNDYYSIFQKSKFEERKLLVLNVSGQQGLKRLEILCIPSALSFID